jgi:hypothetical protein
MIKDHCTRCGKVNPGIHTCNPHAKRSSCCNTQVWIGGGIGIGDTRWYQCTMCEKPCDIKKQGD